MNLRPEKLDQFVGQEQARRILSVLIAAAKQRGETLPHLLLSGLPGLGKTTAARVVSNMMGARLVEVVASSIKTPAEMTQYLMHLQAGDLAFVDEIHTLPRRISEVLFPAMEDGVISVEQHGFNELMKQIGLGHSRGQKSLVTHRLPPFTLIGATTLLGLCSAPLRSRFQVIELQPYEPADLQRIVCGAGERLGFSVPSDLAHEIAIRSRGTARIAVSHLLFFRDCVQGDGGVPTRELLDQAFEMKGIDGHGMGRVDREYLQRLIESDEPVGVGTLASALGESVETLEESVEPFLLREGFIGRTPRGRVATEKARQLFREVIA